MSYQPKPNTGMLWPNDRKSSDNHPDFRGDLHIDRALLRKLAAANQDPLIKVAVAAWTKNVNGKSCLSLQASEPYVKPAPPAERADYDDSDVPF